MPVYKLDDYFDKLNINKITGIKIDVEGYDLFALEGIKNLIQKFKPFLMLEINEQCLQTTGCSSEQMFDLVKSYNYNIFYYDKNGYLSRTTPQYTIEPNSSYNIVCFHKETPNQRWNLNINLNGNTFYPNNATI